MDVLELTVDDLQKMMKLLNVTLNDERLKAVADYLNQNLDAIKPLAHRSLPKELEPTSYLRMLSNDHAER